MSARRTDRWGFSLLGPGDSLADDGFKFTDADIQLMDRLLKYAAENHHHTGAAGSDNTPLAPPSLALSATGGAIGAGKRLFYRVTVVDQDGNESASSTPAYVSTPAVVAEPGAPVLSYVSGVGSLLPGTYLYVLSAYKASSSLETKALNSAVISVLGSSSSNQVMLTLPSLPAGADGFNVYRKSPSGMHFLYLASTTSTSFVDNGSMAPNPDRTLPAQNRSSSGSYVRILYPGATPAIPTGWSWRIYRTEDPTNWNHSLLVQISPGGVPVSTAISYDDVGGSTAVGAPPSVGQVIHAPAKILLTDGAEVTGTLPPGLNMIPHVVTFRVPGVLAVGARPELWVNDFDDAWILSCRAALGTGHPPASTDVIVDVNAYRPGEATPSWQSIYEEGAGRPRVVVGQTIGAATVPLVQRLRAGDALAIDIDQAGGGATPTDAYLTVNVLMYVRRGSTTASWTFS